MDGQGPAPEGVDTSIPNVARMYDYYLGGKDNFAVDREAARKVVAMVPELPATVRGNRDFLGRAVRDAAEAGIRQFIDLGTGLPTRDNVHEVALEAAPGSRVVYVDYDPVVVAHGEALLATTPSVRIIEADLRRPREILDHPVVGALIDLDEPVAVLLAAILHFVPDSEDPHALVAQLRDAMAPGSRLIFSHGLSDPDRPEATKGSREVYASATSPVSDRSRDEILRFLDGFEILPPGLVPAAAWYPGESRDQVPSGSDLIVAAVGRKP
ncbi:SAM-dependent methyltransferase [Nocardiopsis sediminis]|uniref:SAM-dependent methyltransferase n=1 Tax=Nocardiopsis sediminis TaxID=1778267 RepID=A0ABV8FJZ7_9ACTN